MAILPCFLIFLIPFAASISFNLTNISQNDGHMFRLEGGAYISNDGIELTPENDNGLVTGRATYAQPLHLWDNSSRELASFSTRFTFVKRFDPNDVNRPDDDGFIFFLAKNSSSVIPGPRVPDRSNNTNANYTAGQFVWVEFDPYCNPEDNRTSTCDHVGINLNSADSVRETPWFNNISSGRESQVWINYDSASRNLSVSFTGIQNDTEAIFQDGLTVDLRDQLPERVVFGFSSAAGVRFDQSTVTSWMFSSSSLQVDEKNGNKVGLVVGLIVGLSVLITIFVTVAFFLWRKKKKNGDEVEELGFPVEINHELELGATGPRRFSYLELARATVGFAENEKLGEGSFGGVYKGFLKDLSTYVAVKRVSNRGGPK